MGMANTLKKIERLTGKDKIEDLFQKGTSLTEFPFKLIWKISEFEKDAVPAKIVFSVPKRKFKKAYQRNRVKRLCREAYRTNKSILYSVLEEKGVQISLFLIYIGNDIPEYQMVSEKIIVLLKRLIREIADN